MSDYNQQRQITLNSSTDAGKLRLPATEFYYRRAMARSAEIRAQVLETKGSGQDQEKAG